MQDQSYFYLFDQQGGDQLEFNLEENPRQQQRPTLIQPINEEKPQTNFKAINPLDQFKNLPQSERYSYQQFAMRNKRFPGLQMFFSLEEGVPQINQFFGNIDPQVMHEHQNVNFGNLFSQDEENRQEKMISLLEELQTRIQQIQKKVFGGISLNKTIGPAFYDHFQNFALIQNSSPWIRDFEINLRNFIAQKQKIKGPGCDLIIAIYEFWMRNFKQFVHEIWKYSEKFTLNFFKKEKQEEYSRGDISVDSDFKSSTSSQLGATEKQKRKQWNSQQIDILNALIDNDTVFTSSKIKQIAQQFDRTTSSVSSKINKLLKQRRLQEGFTKSTQLTILQKIQLVLKFEKEGLNKQQIITRLGQRYEMGKDENWKKSVNQLLSSRKEIQKKKGVYKLNEQNQYEITNSKLGTTFKDRIIQCLLYCENHQADIKTILDKYLDLFGLKQGYHLHDQENIKNLQANISKTICRYEVFDKTKSKTIYRWYSYQSMNEEINPDSYIT